MILSHQNQRLLLLLPPDLTPGALLTRAIAESRCLRLLDSNNFVLVDMALLTKPPFTKNSRKDLPISFQCYIIFAFN
jgi:hypothetical protein